MSIYTLDKNVLSRLSELSIGDLSLWGWGKKGIGSCGIRMDVAISVFPHSPSLSVSIAHSAICLTSALYNFSILCTPTLIPTLPRIQHNQCFIWPWLNPPTFFFPLHLQERAWVAILSGAHPINLSCQSWDFSTGRVHRSARRVLPLKRESLQTNQKLTFYLLDSEWTRVGSDWLLPFHTTAASQLLPNYVLRAEYQWEGAKLIPL